MPATSVFNWAMFSEPYVGLAGDPRINEYVLVPLEMDDPNITMKEYIRLEEEKASYRGKVITRNATYDKIWYDEDVHDLISVETEFLAIVYNDALTSEVVLSYDLKTDSENDNDKVNMPSFLSSEPTVCYFDDFYYFKDFEKEFLAIAYNDALTSYFSREPILLVGDNLECIFNFLIEPVFPDCLYGISKPHGYGVFTI
ncbi:hypothetical protein Tco_0724993 [Tanacetum coccineum]|uniref:Uncharacterized protein n=1 Tax=Tanacetum coccineum TaxID=301880 RepID=A0ABQ4YD83_9ASTR